MTARVRPSAVSHGAHYKGNKGNLLQHWTFARLLGVLSSEGLGPVHLQLVDAHAMAPLAGYRAGGSGSTAPAFTDVRAALADHATDYEAAWHRLAAGRDAYPSTAAFASEIWPGELSMLLCDIDEDTVGAIGRWCDECSVVGGPVCRAVHGDWRDAFADGLPTDGDALLLTFDPYSYSLSDIQRPPRGDPYLYASDLYRAARAARERIGPAVVQVSTYLSRKPASLLDRTLDDWRRVFGDLGYQPAGCVRSGDSMVSAVFARDLPSRDALRRVLTGGEFERWLRERRYAASRMR